MKIEIESKWKKNSEVTTYIDIFSVFKQHRRRGLVLGAVILNFDIEFIFENESTGNNIF